MTLGRILLRYYLPVLLWLLLMAVFSTEQFSGGFTFRVLSAVAHLFYPDVSEQFLRWLHALLRKSAHIGEYFVFALLLWRALRREAAARWRGSWAVITAALGVLLAGADELHQARTPGRTGSVVDVGWDLLGVALALLWIYWHARRARAGVQLSG